ncbi:MAG: ATP-binding cassette domain-containing protein [Bacteroidota bacterium]
MSKETIISFKNVAARYDDRDLFGDLSFDVDLGEFVYLVGRTGAGKSTILRMMYADASPLDGHIQVGDIHLNRLSPRNVPFLRRKLGIVFQDFQLLPDRNVYQNIYFALRATGWRDTARIKHRVREVLVQVGMAGKLESMPHQLSGGEQQRVAIARALINDPIVLIADEPTGNLDPEASDMVMDILKKINFAGTAVLMATHEYSIIQQYPGRVLQLKDQKLIDYAESQSFLKSLSRKV